MADAIKRFFEKKKRDAVFKKAGAGHKLTDDTRSAPTLGEGRGASTSGSSASLPIVCRQLGELSLEQQMAAQAALARTTQTKPGSASGASGGVNMVAMKQKMVAEEKQTMKAMKDAARRDEGPREVELDTSPVVPCAFFYCPFVGENVVLPLDEMRQLIEETLMAQLTEEPTIISSLMIHTLNHNFDALTLCLTTVCNIIDNIVNNPGVEKYRKIKCSSATLNNKILPIRGTAEFLQAVGFEQKLLPGPDGGEGEEHLVFDPEGTDDLDRLRSGKEILLEAKPIRPVLARCTSAFRIGEKSTNSTNIQVPSDFYNISLEELQREAKLQREAVEQFGMLKTKAMRERDRKRELRTYRYSLIRVRFPDNTAAQGIFSSADKLITVKEWLGKEVLNNDWIPYTLVATGGKRLDGVESSTLAELNLAPASYVNFSYDASVVADVVADRGKEVTSPLKDGYIKQELMLDAKDL